MPPRTLSWIGATDGHLRLIDQTRLPVDLVEIDLDSVEAVWEAIKMLRVRGAPAIGVAAAYGFVLGTRVAWAESQAAFLSRVTEVADYLASSRPTAVNLFWALDRMKQVAEQLAAATAEERSTHLLAEAQSIDREDRDMCTAIGRVGAGLLPKNSGVLTHCNAGGLATAGDGTALSVIFAAHAAGKNIRVYADETRPLLQGARLTTWELLQRDVPVTLICDSMAGWAMKKGFIQAVITGADRIAANGDVANKIGTYSVALLARAHSIPFYVAAPSSTFDLSLGSGEEIPIEERDPEEVTCGFGRRTAPDGVAVYNPAFDVTPADCVTAIVTEKGIVERATADRVRAVLGL